MRSKPLECAKESDQITYVRADEVDSAVWNWVKAVLTTTDALGDGLREQQERQEEVNRPLRNRLLFVEEALSDAQRQMHHLLDLELTGEFPKDLLTNRRGKSEEKLRRLRTEQADLQQRLSGPLATASNPGMVGFDSKIWPSRLRIGRNQCTTSSEPSLYSGSWSCSLA